MSTTNCKNCNNAFTGPYCNQCGQRASTSRITLRSLWHEIIHSFTHIEKGFFYTSIELFIHPGRIINGYLSGKRVNHHKPFGLLFIWIAVYILVDNLLKKETHYSPLAKFTPDDILYEPLKIVYPYYEHYLAFITIPLLVIFYPMILYPLFTRRLNYNYAETLIIGIYFSVTSYIITIIVIILGAISSTYPFIVDNQIGLIAPAFFLLWAFFDVIKKKPYWKSFLMSFMAILINNILFYVYLRFAIPFVVSLFM